MKLKKTQHNVWRGGSGTGDSIPWIGPSIAISPRRPDKPRKPKADKGIQRGTVRVYHSDRGTGFITPDAPGEPDIYVFYRAVPDGVNLRRGMHVSYDIQRDIKRGKTQAANVRVIHD